MTTRVAFLTHPKSLSDYNTTTRHLEAGFGLASLGLLLAVVTLIANIVAASASDATSAAETLAWSFGLTTTAFGTAVASAGVPRTLPSTRWLALCRPRCQDSTCVHHLHGNGDDDNSRAYRAPLGGRSQRRYLVRRNPFSLG